MKEYNLGKPMTWKEFKAMPDDLKKQYLLKLRREYGATQKAIAKMLGVSAFTMCKGTKHLGVEWDVGARMSDKLEEAWSRFCAEGKEESTEQIAPEETTVTAPETAAPVAPPQKGTASVTSGSVSFAGSIGSAMRMLYDLLGETECECTIQWSVRE